MTRMRIERHVARPSVAVVRRMAKMDCVQLSSLLMLALVSVEADVTTFERQFLPAGSQRVHNIFHVA